MARVGTISLGPMPPYKLAEDETSLKPSGCVGDILPSVPNFLKNFLKKKKNFLIFSEVCFSHF